MELQNGRPADAAGRMDKEIRTYDFLDGLGVDYQRMDHEAAFTMEACKEVDEALGVEMCKNLFLCNRQKTDFYLLLIPGDKVFKTKELSKQIGSARLSFAGAEYMEKYLAISFQVIDFSTLCHQFDHLVESFVLGFWSTVDPDASLIQQFCDPHKFSFLISLFCDRFSTRS